MPAAATSTAIHAAAAAHVTQGFLGSDEQGGNVDSKDALEVLERDLGRCADAGIVDQNVDAAVGGGFELPPGVVARELAPLHIVAAATPHFMRGRKAPIKPADLAEHEGVVMRPVFSGRIAQRTLRNRSGEAQSCEQRACITVNDPDAMVRGVLMHMGIGLMAMPHVMHYLESGELVRVLSDWYDHAGAISIYVTSQKLMPAKTHAFVDFVVEQFRQQRLAQRFRAA